MAQSILLKEIPPPGGKFRPKVISNMKNKLFLLSSCQENWFAFSWGGGVNILIIWGFVLRGFAYETVSPPYSPGWSWSHNLLMPQPPECRADGYEAPHLAIYLAFRGNKIPYTYLCSGSFPPGWMIAFTEWLGSNSDHCCKLFQLHPVFGQSKMAFFIYKHRIQELSSCVTKTIEK